MSNDKTALADVQPGGRVRLGDQAERVRFEQYRGGDFERDAQGYYTNLRTSQDWAMWQGALSAPPSQGATALGIPIVVDSTVPPDTFEVRQPSLGGQAAHCPVKHCGMTYARVPSDGRCHACGAPVQPSPGGQDALDCIGRIEEAIEFRVPHDIYAAVHGELAELKAALAARQPVGQITDTEIDARLNALYREMVDSGQHNGGMSGVAWDRAVYRMASSSPAQAVDLDAVRALLQRRIEQWRSHLPADPCAPGTREIETKGEHDYNNDVRIYREGIAVMEEVLSKIDGQAVGK